MGASRHRHTSKTSYCHNLVNVACFDFRVSFLMMPGVGQQKRFRMAEVKSDDDYDDQVTNQHQSNSTPSRSGRISSLYVYMCSF